MAKEFYGYFDSTENDPRVYQSDELADAFRVFGGTGVGAGLTVSPDTGMKVKVNPGYAMIQGYTYSLKDDGGGAKSLSLSPSGSAPRYTRIVLRLDLSSGARSITLLARDGTPAASPVAPALTRTGMIYEISLCKILVPAATGAVAAENILDERSDPAVCGVPAPEGLQLPQLDKRYANTALANNVTTTAAGYALDARQGKVLNDALGAKLNTASVANNLTTTAAGYALDARQGKALSDALANDTADTQVHVYTHAYDSTSKTHKLTTANGKNYANGRMKVTKAFTTGDKFQVNGSTVTAYNGAYALDELPVGRWLTFVYVASEKVINFKSGGAERNYSVISAASVSARPTTALANTFCVITSTAIAKVSMQATQPTGTAGAVWIVTNDANRRITVNVSKRDAVCVYPVGCRQYIGGAWVVKDIYVYQGGAWKTLTQYLYNGGVFYVAGTDVTRFGAVTRNAANYFCETEVGKAYPHAQITWAVNLTGVKNLCAEVLVNQKTMAMIVSNSNGDEVRKLTNGTNVTYTTYSVDVSALNGTHVVSVGTQSGDSNAAGAQVYVKSVYLV